LLVENVPHYDWVGFYLVDKAKKELVLGPFVGEPTEHVRIPFGRGICGQAAERRTTFVVQDVSKEGNYLACSPKVKSEIVIPLFKGGEIIGELDIDSHTLSPWKTGCSLRMCARSCPSYFRPLLPSLPNKVKVI